MCLPVERCAFSSLEMRVDVGHKIKPNTIEILMQQELKRVLIILDHCSTEGLDASPSFSAKCYHPFPHSACVKTLVGRYQMLAEFVFSVITF